MLRDFIKAAVPGKNGGEPYILFLDALHRHLQPRSYFEIGTATGTSLNVSRCPSICVDPEFNISTNVFKGRSQTLMYQKTSDDYFRDHKIKDVFPDGVDLCFLDGMHRIEYLYRDFMNAEKACHPRSMILLHDCLPLNARMAERTVILGNKDEPYWDAWTGDVWKLVPVLKKHRPDLRIFLIDAPPTGLVLITNVDPSSTVLDDKYYGIMDEFAGVTLDQYGMDKLYNDFPTLDSQRLLQEPHALTAFFSLY